MRNTACAIVASVVSLGAVAPVQAAVATPIPVRVIVTAEPQGLREDVLAALKADLAKVDGVSVKETGPSVTLDVIVVEFRMGDGRLSGYMIYSGGYQPGPVCPSSSGVTGQEPVVMLWQALKMARPDLQEACRHVVAEFSVEIIDPMKREIKKVEDSFKPKGSGP
jgi:hypothetical protein